MPTLADTQLEFTRALFCPCADTAGVGTAGVSSPPPFDAMINTAGVSAAARLDVYRNNVFSNYRGALQAVYPVIERLVGTAFFRQACDRYIVAYPSGSGDLHDFGDQFAAFLTGYRPAAELVYLPDVARLEWQYHRVFHAAAHAPLALTRLASIAPDAYASLRFSLHPATALLRSAYPVLRIWHVNQPDYTGDERVDLGEGGDALLMTRADFVVTVARVPAAEYEFLAAFHNGAQLAQALDAALESDAEFDLQAILAKHVSAGVIVDFAVAVDT